MIDGAFPKRSIGEVVSTVMERLGGRAPIGLVRDGVRNLATHAEWEAWADKAVQANIRDALRKHDHYAIEGEYVAVGLFTVEDYVILAKSQARRGREFFEEVRRLAAECDERLGESFDAEEIIRDALA